MLASTCAVSASAAVSTFYTFDERGNVSQRTSSTRAVLSSDVYDAYGTRTSTATQADPVGFGGQFGYLTDTNTGLILCTHRFYDPANGRWLTRDPIGYRGGVNLYGYVGNSPTVRIDPNGLEDPDPNKHFWCGILGGFAGLAAGGVVTVVIAGATGGAGTAVGVFAGAIVAGGFGQLVTNECNGDPPAQDVLLASCLGGLGGAAGPVVGKGIDTVIGAAPK